MTKMDTAYAKTVSKIATGKDKTMRTPTTKKPNKYYSFTRLNLYHANPNEYYMQYVLGHKPKPTRSMEFGSIGHKALAEPDYDWRRALMRKKFMAHDEMVMERALREHPVYPRREIEFSVKFNGIWLYGWIDAKRPGVISETKFSANGTWNKQTVDDNVQLGFYWLVGNLMGWKINEAILHDVNNKTGQVTSWPTVRSKQDLDGIRNWIIYAVDGIEKGVFA